MQSHTATLPQISHYITSPIGIIQLSFDSNEQLSSIKLNAHQQTHHTANISPTAQNTIVLLTAYFSGKKVDFSAVQTATQVSPFIDKVLQAVKQIPYGKTITYGELADIIGSSPRAVGQGLGRNPLPLIYPCHRVVAKNNIGGFSRNSEGTFIDIKSWLLAHELKYN